MAAQFIVWKLLLPGIDHWNQYAKFGLRTSVFLALSLAMASASYHFLEKPFLSLKDRLR
jgi:peptidoglycan/LPS O-acetylase OafA/YrhL